MSPFWNWCQHYIKKKSRFQDYSNWSSQFPDTYRVLLKGEVTETWLCANFFRMFCRHQIKNGQIVSQKQQHYSVSTFNKLSSCCLWLNMRFHCLHTIRFCYDLHFTQCANFFGNRVVWTLFKIPIFEKKLFKDFAHGHLSGGHFSNFKATTVYSILFSHIYL